MFAHLIAMAEMIPGVFSRIISRCNAGGSALSQYTLKFSIREDLIQDYVRCTPKLAFAVPSRTHNMGSITIDRIRSSTK